MSFFHENAVWLLPVLIFLARIVDVSIGTLRIIFLSRGMRFLAPICGFFEVLVWLMAIGQIMQNLTSWVNYAAYAGGFATGNYVGLWLESRLAMGLLSVWVITTEDAAELSEWLQRERFGITSVSAQGAQGLVRMIIIVIKRRDLPQVMTMLREHNPEAFVAVNDIRSVRGGVFPTERTGFLSQLIRYRHAREGK